MIIISACKQMFVSLVLFYLLRGNILKVAKGKLLYNVVYSNILFGSLCGWSSLENCLCEGQDP